MLRKTKKRYIIFGYYYMYRYLCLVSYYTFLSTGGMIMLETSFILALMVYFIHCTTWTGMIFEKFGDWSEKTFGEYWSKPISSCPICMVPWWGTIFYILGHLSNLTIFQSLNPLYIVYILFAAGGINTVIIMLNKEYDVAKKEDKLLNAELDKKDIS